MALNIVFAYIFHLRFRNACLIVNGNWGSWSHYGSCSQTCGNGTHTRHRSCNNPAPSHDGTYCKGLSLQTEICSVKVCAVNGNWGSWSPYGSCSQTCGNGTQLRHRSCNNPAPSHDGTYCKGLGLQTETCNVKVCPVNGNWGSWSHYGSCSQTCGNGTQLLHRSCNNPAPLHDGTYCKGLGLQTETCNVKVCPVNGSWGSWSPYGSCSQTCGNGTQLRHRSCNNPAPSHDGTYCKGLGLQTETCNVKVCPVDGNWGSWSSYGSCSHTCGHGTHTRHRSCNNPAPSHGGAYCKGLWRQTENCNVKVCPVDGSWGIWSPYGSCSQTCGNGTHTRHRSCNNPAPSHGGAYCKGLDLQTETCNVKDCPVDGNWGSWSSYGSCSHTCGHGTHTRHRSCNNPAPSHGGAYCKELDLQTETCNLGVCPVDGEWSTWSAFNTCSASCGNGTHARYRNCTQPAPSHGGALCDGPNQETDICKLVECPVDGQWADWSQYGPCSKSCGTGTSTRQRTCSNPSPSHGGKPCEGVAEGSKDCNTEACPGNTAMCPSFVKQQSARDHYPLGQYKDSCYEFLHYEAIPHVVADQHCKYRGGFIVDIQSAGEQAYIESFIRSLHSNGPFWTGLFDLKREGHFEWTSGSSVSYNNWLPGRPNHAYSNFDDCVEMSVSSSTFGKWNDVTCEYRLNVLCEFKISGSQAIGR